MFVQRGPEPRLFFIQTCRNFIGDSPAYTNLYELEPATGKLLRHKQFTGFGEFSHSDQLDSSHFVLVADNSSRQIYWLNMDFLPEGKPQSIPSPDYIATSRAINAGIDFPPLYALLLQGGGEMLVDDNLKPQVYSEYHLDPYLSNQPISPRSRQSYVVRDGAGLTVIRARDKDGRPHLVYAASNPLWWFHRYRWEITIFIGLMAIGGIGYFGYKFWRRRRQHQRDVGIWQQFMSPQLIELFKHKDPRKDPIHLRVRVTIMNSDLRNFTNYSQNAGSPEIVFDTLSPYYEAVSVEVANNGGIMDKFMGDGAMALFGVPLKDDERRNYCLRATNVCSDILKQFDEVKKKWLENGYPAKDVGLGFGIATGSVSFGTVGSSRRFDLTVIGSAANLSSKLCAMAKHGEVKMDSETYEAVREQIGECEKTVHSDIKGFEDAGVNVFTWRPER